MEETKILEESLRETMEQYLAENQYAKIRTMLQDMNYVDIENLLADMQPDRTLRIFRMLP